MAHRLAALFAFASLSTAHQELADHLSSIEYGSKQRFSKIMANMSTQDALRVVPSLPKNIQDAIQCEMKKGSFLQRSDCDKAGEVVADQGSLDDARKLLNEMGVESEVNLDAEKIRCAQLLDKQAKVLIANRNELNNYNAQAAAARGRILEAQGIISEKQALLPTLQDELEGHRKKNVKRTSRTSRNSCESPKLTKKYSTASYRRLSVTKLYFSASKSVITPMSNSGTPLCESRCPCFRVRL